MYIASPNINQILKWISQQNISSEQGLLILMGEKNAPDMEIFFKKLAAMNITYFGGIFPGIIYDDSYYEEGAILKILPLIEQPIVIRGLES